MTATLPATAHDAPRAAAHPADGDWVVRSGLTFLVTDIEGSTALNSRLGDERWLELLHAHNALVREQVALHGGRELKFLGDGFLLLFERTSAAVDSAIAIQRSLAAAGDEVRVRMSAHTGRAWVAGDDALGLDVTVAYRLLSVARGGEILLSGPAREALGSAHACTGRGRTSRLKGLPRQKAFPVAWRTHERRPAPGRPRLAGPRRGIPAVLGAVLALLLAAAPPAIAGDGRFKSEHDRIFGGPGRDLLSGGSGRDRCDGGSGRDRASCERRRQV